MKRCLRQATALAALGLSACSSQFVDPILESPSGPVCPNELVAELSGGIFASIPRVVEGDFTVEAWIRTTTVPTGVRFSEGSALVFADVTTIQAHDFAVGLLNEKFVVNVGLPDITLASGSNVATGKWVHVAGTRTQQSGEVLLLVNGAVEVMGTANTETLSDATEMTIGGRATRNFYTGQLSELRIWSVARSPAQIAGTMKQRLVGDEPGLVAYFPLNEGEGALAHDASPSRNDAAFDGPLQWAETAPPFCPDK